MLGKSDLEGLVIKALEHYSKSATIVQVCRYVWQHYEDELRSSGDLFYTWQYDVRWAATRLRKRHKMKQAWESTRGVWELAS